MPSPNLSERLSTPFGDEHGAPLRLRGGIDGTRLHLITGVLTLLALCSAAAAPLAVHGQGILAVGALVLFWRLTRYYKNVLPPSEFSLRADGACHYREREGITWNGRVEPGGWQSTPVVLLCLKMPFGRFSVPILKARQRPGEFRRLRVWLNQRRIAVPEY